MRAVSITTAAVALAVALVPSVAYVPTEGEVAAATAAIDVILADDAGGNDPRPELVRLAFHACVGGCDGCINLAQADNAGLDRIVGRLNTAFDELSTALSRADFWALAGVRAVNVASGRTLLTAEFGREDCATSPTTTAVHTFPDATQEWGHVTDVMGSDSDFGLSAQELVALIGGGHSLGTMTVANSGFLGQWDNSPDTLSNTFFVELYRREWQQVQAPGSAKWQWTPATGGPPGGRPPLTMLNTDIAMVYSLTIADANGQVTGACGDGSDDCVPAGDVWTVTEDPSPFALEYSQNGNKFFTDFASAFAKMQRAGVDASLTSTLRDSTPSPAATPSPTATSSPAGSEGADGGGPNGDVDAKQVGLYAAAAGGALCLVGAVAIIAMRRNAARRRAAALPVATLV